jgi:PAS domain S-box-containing protein
MNDFTENLALADFIEDHVFIKDLDHQYIRCNKAFSKFAGFSSDEISGKTDLDIFDKEKANFYRSKDDEVITSKNTVTYRTWYYYENGENIYFETKKSPLYDSDNNLIGVIGVSRDISEIHNQEEKCKSHYTRLESLIKHLNAGVLVENEKRNILVVNQKFLDIFKIGATINQLIGTDCSNAAEMSKHLIKDPDEFVLKIEEILYRREVITGQVIEFANGDFYKRDFIPVHDNDQFIGQMWIYTDVTLEKKNEKEREKFIEELSESNQRIARDAQQLTLMYETLASSKETLKKITEEIENIMD